MWGSRSTKVVHWTTGQYIGPAIDPAPGACFIIKFISLAQVIPRPHSAELWPETPLIAIHFSDIDLDIGYWFLRLVVGCMGRGFELIIQQIHVLSLLSQHLFLLLGIWAEIGQGLSKSTIEEGPW